MNGKLTSSLAPAAERRYESNARPPGPDLGDPLKRLRRLVLGIARDEVSFVRRGFRWTDPTARCRLERIGLTFLDGYHAALDDDRPGPLAHRLAGSDLEQRGFAFEGAAMALVLRDRLVPWRASRFQAFLAGPGEPHTYMMLVGSGWALARLRRPVQGWLAKLDPLLGWLAVDGYAFHEAYFDWPASLGCQLVPGHLSPYARRVFDQGLGRGLWFVNGTDPTMVVAAVSAFPPTRRADLWSGIGLACAYAGGTDRAGLEALRRAAGPFRPHFAQGAAFAAEARSRADNMAPHTDLACRILGDLSVRQAVQLVNQARLDLPPDGCVPAYEVWRRRIRSHFLEEVRTA